eukprot:CAMPEP_0197517416 /NCGR_PEP_ID=MMETSP1318-20131121/2423_1 /TAXON_ID=552666 /ORGANISM="Partenskyella glossopodia, Strain RCC365" /LENGTH=322 /DNA_ID=CAMNT_0043066947 /DNA_START=182 /DNA_END=1150 /DNA_ORIENTATION=+
MVSNQHFDEAVEVSQDESTMDDSGLMNSTDMMQQQHLHPTQDRSNRPIDLENDPSSQSSNKQNLGAISEQHEDHDNDHDEESSSFQDEDDGEPHDESGEHIPKNASNLYNATEYKDLDVSPEIRQLFDHIERYKPAIIELDTKMKPFIPDYIPAVGDIDSFLKVPHPQIKNDGLGLTVLDEPAAQQSDPTVLDMRLRLASKQTNLKPMTVGCIDHADKQPKKITRWIENIQKVHREKPPPTVVYSRNMPDIEQLMQVWPSEFEDLLKAVPLPPADIDLSTEQYARIVCSILDVPVYDNLTESLHVLFTLYSVFKNNQHFQGM